MLTEGDSSYTPLLCSRGNPYGPKLTPICDKEEVQRCTVQHADLPMCWKLPIVCYQYTASTVRLGQDRRERVRAVVQFGVGGQ